VLAKASLTLAGVRVHPRLGLTGFFFALLPRAVVGWASGEPLGPVERVAKDMSTGGGLSDLNLYLSLIRQEVVRTRREADDLPNKSTQGGFGTDLRARLVALEGNYDKLARITGERR